MSCRRWWFAVLASVAMLGACDRPESKVEPLVPEAGNGAGIADGKKLARKVAVEQYKTNVAAADTAYAAAKEKCELANAATGDACRAQAKTDYEASIAQANAQRDAAEP